MKQIFLAGFLLIIVGIPILAQTNEEMAKARQAEQAAMKAYRAKDNAEFLAQMKLANASRPNHSRIIYNLAVAFALNGQLTDSLNSLDRLASMGLFFDIAKDEDLRSVADNERFKLIAGKFAQNKTPKNKSTQAFTLDDKTLISESVAYFPKTKAFFVGSVHQRKVVMVKNGVTSDFSAESDGLWSVLGLRVDEARGLLWVCTAAIPQMKGFDSKDKGRSGLAKYDLRSGKLVKKYILPEGDHLLGDVIISRDGSIYASDSSSPAIYKIDPKVDELTEFVRFDNFVSLQGLAFSEGEREMFVADYSKGIFRINMATKQIVQLKPAESVTLLGIDGLYHYRGKLIAIQNGVSPNRVVGLTLSGDSVTRFTTLEANHADFIEPTLGTIVEDEFYYVANSQWPFVSEKGVLEEPKLKQPVVLKLSLKKALAK
ncbi:MAG TPA: hypothetical protein PKA82_10550 [Pyrinomonadaceae bacterium]|nr:hypothetical protein [Pyrinomonadaceae bacterium]